MTTSRRPWQLPISESELTGLTKTLDEAHREALPVMSAQAQELSEELTEASADGRPSPPARRTFLLTAGGTVAAFALAACGSTSANDVSAIASGSDTASATVYTGDYRAVALSAALENQAVGAYQGALSAAQAGKLGTVPPAVTTFAQTAMAQHTDHAKAWNSVLQNAGKPPINGTPLSNQKAVNDALSKVTDVGGAAALALRLENEATQTYLFAVANVTSPGGIAIASTIAPVEAMHAAILHFMLGQDPVPDDFITTTQAVNPSVLTV